MQAMPNALTVEEIFPLVEALPPAERARLLRLITRTSKDDFAVYAAIPPASEEFSGRADARLGK
jgi:hypothetical protein